MRVPKFLGGKVLAVAIALTMLPAAIPSTAPVVGISSAKAEPFYGGRHFRGGGPRGYYGGPRRYYGGGRYHGGRQYYRGRRGGSALAGAIVGLGVGAAIASAAQPRYYGAPRYAAPVYAARPWTREWYRYCASRYRSFDPASGTFQPYNGPRQMCR